MFSRTCGENGYAIGGEQSGHVILLHHATTGDGELTAGKLLKLLAESGKKMSELNGIYAQYPQVLVNVVANAARRPPTRVTRCWPTSSRTSSRS